ncbi:RNA ligase [compost metagenome]
MRWEMIKNDLGNIELFGENLYAIHSIQYQKLENHFYVFAVRCMDKWLSWDEVKFYAALFDFPIVPELKTVEIGSLTVEQLKADVLSFSQQSSQLSSIDIHTNNPCTCEGVVTRNTQEFSTNAFAENVFKYVRKGHVKTDEHWTRNWKRAKLMWEH